MKWLLIVVILGSGKAEVEFRDFENEADCEKVAAIAKASSGFSIITANCIPVTERSS